MHSLGLGIPLVLAAVLVLSAVMKWRSPQPARDSFVALRLPGWLSRSVAPALLPWGELALAVGLLVLPGVVGIGFAAASVVLMLVYLIVVLRALSWDEKVVCGCFGELGLGEVTPRTAVRNAVLVALAVTSLVSMGRGASTVQRWAAATSSDAGWLVVAVTAVVVAWLIGAGASKDSSAPEASAHEHDADYLRTPIPYGRLRTAEGTEVHLRDLAFHQAQLLVFLSTTCAGCQRIAEQLPAWAAELDPAVVVRPVYGGRVNVDDPTLCLHDWAMFDPAHEVSGTLRLGTVPAAVLLGADGLLAGGPVEGEADTRELCETVVDQVRAARLPENHPHP
ncbi:TlpA family protein disulfide reductase [Aestuariimicrobium soli]|uniref:TlpA family protein disulfide reductase n=1 Tax=Aestuariimicrobium soli TaxID=2035834 RepID=UPI003EBDC59B